MTHFRLLSPLRKTFTGEQNFRWTHRSHLSHWPHWTILISSQICLSGKYFPHTLHFSSSVSESSSETSSESSSLGCFDFTLVTLFAFEMLNLTDLYFVFHVPLLLEVGWIFIFFLRLSAFQCDLLFFQQHLHL
jgi:hypothetical protein